MSVFDYIDKFFVPVLGTVNEGLEMIILHTRETSIKSEFLKVNFKKFIFHNLARDLYCHSTDKY